MTDFLSFLKRAYTALNPPTVTKSAKPIQIGILGAAAIAPIALIAPAKSHSEVVVIAVAARDKTRAEKYAKKYGIAKVYGGGNGYQELLDDPEVDAVYNPLPNGLHYEWTMKALKAGKHVLVEKPSSNTADETRQMFELAESKGLVLLEAFHYRFHPAVQHVKKILDSGELGAIKNISASIVVTSGIMKAGDIRWNYELGGGAMMDAGCYLVNCIRYLSGSNPTSVVYATPTLYPDTPTSPVDFSKIDTRTVASLSLPDNITGNLTVDLALAPTIRFIPKMPGVTLVVECQGGEVDFWPFIMPTVFHSITVKTRQGNEEGKRRKVRVEKKYIFDDKGKEQDWWSTYRFQLEAFVDKIQGRPPQTWVTKEDSIENIQWVEEVYKASGLGSRPRSTFVM